MQAKRKTNWRGTCPKKSAVCWLKSPASFAWQEAFLLQVWENLKSAAKGEHEEWAQLYANSAKIAEEEGEKEAANVFKQVLESEKHHEARFLELIKNIENSTVFEKEEETLWVCRKCGRIVKSKKAPAKCPTCEHPQSYFEILCERF